LLPRLSLIASELIHVLEREPGIGEPIPLLDDFSVEEGSILVTQNQVADENTDKTQTIVIYTSLSGKLRFLLVASTILALG